MASKPSGLPRRSCRVNTRTEVPLPSISGGWGRTPCGCHIPALAGSFPVCVSITLYLQPSCKTLTGSLAKQGDLTMTPEETVEHALSALVQGNVQGHIRYVADDVTWKLNENSAQHGKSTYQQVITAMTQDRDEMIVGFQLDGAHLDSRERVWIRTLEDRRMRWRDLAGRTGERTERVASAYRVVDGAIIEIRMTALGGSNRRFTYPPSITLP